MTKQEVQAIFTAHVNMQRGLTSRLHQAEDLDKLKTIDPADFASMVIEFICNNFKDNLDEVFEFIAWVKDLLK